MRSARKSEFTVPADLGPSDAHDVREQLLSWIQTKRSRGTVEIDHDEPSISALQLIVAATKSESDNPPALGPLAEKAVAALATPTVLEFVKR